MRLPRSDGVFEQLRQSKSCGPETNAVRDSGAKLVSLADFGVRTPCFLDMRSLFVFSHSNCNLLSYSYLRFHSSFESKKREFSEAGASRGTLPADGGAETSAGFIPLRSRSWRLAFALPASWPVRMKPAGAVPVAICSRSIPTAFSEVPHILKGAGDFGDAVISHKRALQLCVAFGQSYFHSVLRVQRCHRGRRIAPIVVSAFSRGIMSFPCIQRFSCREDRRCGQSGS